MCLPRRRVGGVHRRLRGLATQPVLVISDGAPGLCAAIDQVFPNARRQRCVIHRARNVVAKVSAADQAAVTADFWEIFDLPEEVEPGEAAVAEASRRAEQFAATWRPRYPAAVDCLLDDFALLTAHLHHPRAHWPRIRHTNLIQRTFGETRRQVKVIGRLPGQRSALSLVWAVLDRAGAGWRGITYTPTDTRQLQTIRRELAISRPRPKKEPATPDAVAITPAA